MNKSEQATKSDEMGKNKPPPDSDSDSDSGADVWSNQEFIAMNFINIASPRLGFNTYKKILEREAQGKEHQNQGSNLVKRLVNYMASLEGRIDRLETSSVKKAKKAKGDGQNGRSSETSDTTVEIGVKFFNSVGHIGEDGAYLDVHDGSKGGTYMCDHDTKYLIRVLYSWVRQNDAQRGNNLESEPADPEDIDILTFGVLPEPITAFFEKELDITLFTDPLIRFEKPFRPLIRHYSRVKEQLLKLEHRYG